jgi:membrane protein DedA with SNARE-associated domain
MRLFYGNSLAIFYARASRILRTLMLNKLIVALLALSTPAAYTVVFVLMALQSACIPIPSEVIMPFAGYRLGHDLPSLLVLAVVASLASNLGSIPAYYLGAKGGRPMIERYGRYILLSHRDLDLADRFFQRFGSIAVLVGRMLPIVRTFIAFPAGIARMNQMRFHIYTFLGSFPWCFALAYIGMKLGARWDSDPRFKSVFHHFQLGVEVVIVAGIVWFVWSHWKNRRVTA